MSVGKAYKWNLWLDDKCNIDLIFAHKANRNLRNFKYGVGSEDTLVKTKSIFTSEGRIAVFEEEDDVLYKFEYKLKDHLGNTRVVFGGHTSGKVEHIQRTTYYPFGLVMDQQDYITFAGLNSKHAPFENKFLYNGKEWQNEEIGGVKLDWYDFQTRFMDPQLARFHSIDLLSEKYSFQSPYAYAANNPIRFIDFLGMGPDDPPGFWQSFGSTLGTYFEGAMTGVVDRIYYPIDREGSGEGQRDCSPTPS